MPWSKTTRTLLLPTAVLLVLAAPWIAVAPIHAQNETNAESDAVRHSAAGRAIAETAPVASMQNGQAAEESPIPTRNLLSIVRDGGELMIPLLVCSFILMVVVFERIICLAPRRIIPGPFVKRFSKQLRQGQLDRDEAIRLCQESGSPVAKVFEAAAVKWGRASVEIEQAVLDAGERVANTLRRNLRVINGVATISPLLGLLGTVVGMIRAFNAIAMVEGMGRPGLLAGGIGQALLTTAAGLSIAIPALIFYMYFVSRVDRLIVRIDTLSQEVVDLIAAKAQPSQPPATSSKKNRRNAA